MLSDTTLAALDEIADSYREGQPFPNVVVDNFFDPEVAENLLADFPEFNEALAINEHGRVGYKAVNSNIREISPFYNAFSEYLLSEAFVESIEHITGIRGLISLPDETGGTHESRSGAMLAPHIDYNYLGEANPLHRRLNLLFYLNKNWLPEWGGNLELHSNVREWSLNQIAQTTPVFNRAVIMETSERSWHGYDRIRTPSPEVTRKSISIYMFSEDRPREEIAPRHGTFYVQPPLSQSFSPGYMLAEQDVAELEDAIEKRDRWIRFYQDEVLKHSSRADRQTERGDWLLTKIRRTYNYMEQGDLDSARAEIEQFVDRSPDSDGNNDRTDSE